MLAEFNFVEPHLAPGGLIVFDNTYQIAEEGEDQRVYGALQKLIGEGRGQIINLPYVSWYTPGVAIFQKEAFPKS